MFAGGGFGGGSGSDLQNRGTGLMSYQDVIFVSMNYRQGPFGFLGSEALREYTFQQTGTHTTGNQGMLDYRAALAFVKEHIRDFGDQQDMNGPIMMCSC